MSWEIIFLIVAAFLFGFAALKKDGPKYQLGWAGMLSLTLYFLFTSGVLPPQ